MKRQELLDFMRQQVLAVQASVNDAGRPQAAVVGVVVSDSFEIFFDTRAGARKAVNLRRDSHASIVLGWDLRTGRTVQVDGIADEPEGEDLARLKALYFTRFPDGRERERWPDIAYFRVRPTFLRFSDFAESGARVEEFDARSLHALS